MALPTLPNFSQIDWPAVGSFLWNSGIVVWACFLLTGVVLGFAMMAIIIKANSSRF